MTIKEREQELKAIRFLKNKIRKEMLKHFSMIAFWIAAWGVSFVCALHAINWFLGGVF